jgi:hypothetical protein
MKKSGSQNIEGSQASLICRQSALKRRRLRADYALSVMPLVTNHSRTLVFFMLGCMVVAAAVAGSSFVPAALPRSQPLPLSQPTRAHQVDRFSIEYTVRDGDTLWAIAARFYGKPSVFYIQKLRTANPWLPKKDGELKIGVSLKIPIA